MIQAWENPGKLHIYCELDYPLGCQTLQSTLFGRLGRRYRIINYGATRCRSDDCLAWFIHDKTCRPIGSTLGGCGEVVMPPCKAPLIMYPLAKASAQTARRVCSRKCLREKARVDSMVNICECPKKNVVNNDKLKTQAKGLGQKARRRVQGSVVFLSWANNTVGVQDRPNLSSSSERNVVSPKSPSE
jgi:hypothetical protein